MIIKATFRDNDYTAILERFFERFKFCNYNLYYQEEEDVFKYKEKAIENDELLKKIIYNSTDMTEDEYDKFIDIVTEAIKIYVSKRFPDECKFLVERLEVDALDRIGDDNENGEVVYYFINAERVIVE